MKKKKRREIYKKALKALRKRKRKSGFYGVCLVLLEVSPGKEMNRHNYPELFRFKPQMYVDGFWWDSTDYWVRENVLLFCIEMTK